MDFDGVYVPRPSLMERLRDDPMEDAWDDWLEAGQAGGRKEMLAAERALVADLENLLNARRPFLALPERFADIEMTTPGYGLPDVAYIGVKDAARRAAFLRDLEKTIAAFEPRLSDIRLEEADCGGRAVRLSIRVTALFAMDGGPTPISFETVVAEGADRLRVELNEGSA